MNSNMIKIFACDHRNLNGKEWNYPFIRIGTGFNNDCVIKDTDGETICDLKNNKFLSEYTSIWWIWKHLNELKNPKYIGFTHYRRFFTTAIPNYGVFPLHLVNDELTHEQINSLVLNDQLLLNIIVNNNTLGILPTPFPDYSYCNKCKSVIDLMAEESNMIDLGFTYESCIMMFNILSLHMKKYFSDISIAKSFTTLDTFHFNIFILENTLFNTFNIILEKTIFECIDNLNVLQLNLHSRALSYVIERFSSCIFLAMIYNNIKFTYIPLLMINNKLECI